MARSRNIKPGFYHNEDLAECSVWARYIFPGLWMLADREGRLEDRPKRIKAEILPFDPVDVEPLLAELDARGFIIRYEADGRKFIQIVAFKKHQTPHYSEKVSAIPGPELSEDSGSTPGNSESPITSKFQEHSENSPGALPENSRSVTPIKRGSQPPDSLIPDSLIPGSGSCEPSSPAPRASRLPRDWKLPIPWMTWALAEQPTWNERHCLRVSETFRDHWTAKGGKDAAKLDWEATWRNWVRREQPLRKSSGGNPDVDDSWRDTRGMI